MNILIFSSTKNNLPVQIMDWGRKTKHRFTLAFTFNPKSMYQLSNNDEIDIIITTDSKIHNILNEIGINDAVLISKDWEKEFNQYV